MDLEQNTNRNRTWNKTKENRTKQNCNDLNLEQKQGLGKKTKLVELGTKQNKNRQDLDNKIDGLGTKQTEIGLGTKTKQN